MKTLTGFIIEKLKITKDVQDNVSNFLDGFDASSIQYWKSEIGLDPTKIDYTQNKEAEKIILRFGKANKIEQLFDYLAAGCPEFIPTKSGIKDWLKFVATTDINDFETYNGKIEEKLHISNNKLKTTEVDLQKLWDLIRQKQNDNVIVSTKIVYGNNLEDIPCDVFTFFNKDGNRKLEHTHFAIKALRSNSGNVLQICLQQDPTPDGPDEDFMRSVVGVYTNYNTSYETLLHNTFDGYNAFLDFYNYCLEHEKNIHERLFINKNKKDIFSTLKPATNGCYNMFKVQSTLIDYEKQTGKSYDLTNIYDELPIYDHGKTEYEVQDITATEKYILIGAINKENGKPNKFEFGSLSFLSNILGKHDESKGCAVINYIVDDIENNLE